MSAPKSECTRLPAPFAKDSENPYNVPVKFASSLSERKVPIEDFPCEDMFLTIRAIDFARKAEILLFLQSQNDRILG
jgi:hypothetical protein